MTKNTLAIINKVQKYDSHMKMDFTGSEIQITATLLTVAPLAVMLRGDLNEWIRSEKTLWDEPEPFFQTLLRNAIEESLYFEELLNLLRGTKLVAFSSNEAIFEIETAVELIIER